ncbi:MAG TPA: 3'-5' exonuclease [Pseudorhizobium sp.]|jgi:exodeoxyribonuclease X|nr:3'-5' exonuclease [Pseudorhizobium sp.]
MQKIRVVDFETTGFPEDAVRAVCEVGYTDLTADWQIGPTVAFYANPGHPIPPQTRAVHHISDADVAEAVSPDVRGGSVCLNSFGRFAKWISASIMPPPSLVPAR